MLLLVGVASLHIAAAQQAEVFYPKFPVLVDRPYNIVCEISIDGNDYIGKMAFRRIASGVCL